MHDLRGLGQFGPVVVGGEGDPRAVGPGGLRASGRLHPLVLGPGDGGAVDARARVGVSLEDALDEGGGVDRGAGGGAELRVREGAGPGVELQAGGPRGAGFPEGVLVERGGLRDGDGLGDVDVAGAYGVGARGAVLDEARVDAGGLGAATPVVVVAVEGGGAAAVDLGDLEGPGGVAGGVGAVRPAVRLRGEDRQARAGQPHGQHGVGGCGGDAQAAVAVGPRAERDAGERGGRGLRPRGVGEGGGHDGRGDVRAVLEGGLAQGEAPGAVVLTTPGGRERGGRGAVGVQGGQALGDAETTEQRGVGAVRREVLGGREGEGDTQPGARPAVVRRRLPSGGGEAAGQAQDEREGGEDPGTGLDAEDTHLHSICIKGKPPINRGADEGIPPNPIRPKRFDSPARTPRT